MARDTEKLDSEEHSGKEDVESAFSLCMESLDELMAARKTLEDKLREGFMDIARARYAMGMTRVTSLQYDIKNMKTTTFIVADSGETDKASSTNSLVGDARTWQLQRRMNEDSASCGPSEDVASSSGVEASNSGLRRRPGREAKESSPAQTVRGDTVKLADVTNDLKKEKLEKQPSLDSSPLRWFGGIVSPHLTSAQGRFSSVMEDVVRVVRAQARMQAAQQQYCELTGKQCGYLALDDGNDDESGCVTEEDVF